MYREAALKCHPDINPDGEDIFKDLNKAYEAKDYHTIKKIHKNVVK
jgi:DnaJ-class molecular chaperone